MKYIYNIQFEFELENSIKNKSNFREFDKIETRWRGFQMVFEGIYLLKYKINFKFTLSFDQASMSKLWRSYWEFPISSSRCKLNVFVN